MQFHSKEFNCELKELTSKVKILEMVHFVTHTKDGKHFNFYFLLVPEMDFILSSFLLIKEQNKEREIRLANFFW